MQIICTSLQTDDHASISSLTFFTGRMLFLTPNQQCQSTEGKQKETQHTKTSSENQPLASSFLHHHWTPERRGMPAFQCRHSEVKILSHIYVQLHTYIQTHMDILTDLLPAFLLGCESTDFLSVVQSSTTGAADEPMPGLLVGSD